VNIGDPDLTNLRLGVRDDWPLLQSALMKAMAAVSPQDMNQIRQKWIVADAETTPQETAVPISYGRLILYGIGVFLILTLLAWILIKTIKKEHIAVNFGSRWFRGLVLAGLSIFVIIVCLLGWFMLEQNRYQILAGIGKNLTETLKTADDRLNLWVGQKTSSLKLLGRDPELVTLTKRLLAVLPNREDLLASGALQDTRVFFKNNEDILSNIGFFIINADHISIGSVRDTNIGTRNLISLQRPKLLRQAFEGEVLFVPPIESDVPLGKGPRADGARNPSTKFFMGPIQDSNGQIIAVMTLRVDPSEDFSRILPSSETRKTGETYAFSEHGELLSESKFDDQLRRIGLLTEDQKSALNIEIRDPGVNLVKGLRPNIERSQQPLTRMASRAIQLKLDMEKAGQTYGRSKIEIDTKGYQDYRGVPVFGAWLWSAELGIGLATEIDVKEAMSSHYQVRRTVFGVLGFTLLLSVGAVLLVLILGERTSQALRKSQNELELRVQERTAELRESEIKLRTIFEKSPLGILHIGKDGIVLDCNDRHAEIMGSSREIIIGMNLRKEIENDQLSAAVFGALAGEQTEFEAEYTSVSGGRTVLVRSIFNPTEPGTSPTEVINTTEDITERKRAEKAVKKSEREYRTLFENASVGILVAQDQVFRFVNPQMEKLLAYKQSELKSRSIIDFFHPDDRNMIQERHEKRLKGESVPDVYNTRIVDRYGNTKWIEVKEVPIQWDDRPAALGFMADITERKRAEEELNRNVDELERFNKLAIGRELKMIQLKEEINELLGQSNQDKRYKIVK
jgi:PAS domain S-box-containing protein